jgi:hypothetical protein
MYKPRRVTLTEAERRKLRAIEEALTAEDPALAGLLDGTRRVGPANRRVRRTIWTYILVTVFLFALGVVTADPGLMSLGLILLLIAPAVVMCVAELVRRWPSSRWWSS